MPVCGHTPLTSCSAALVGSATSSAEPGVKPLNSIGEVLAFTHVSLNVGENPGTPTQHITTVRLNVEENQLVNVFGEFRICLGDLKGA